jgi:uncharacterized membrane protein
MAKRDDRVVLTRRKALLFTIILSIVLFLAGLFSGLSASQVIKEQTQEDVSFLVGYVDTLEKELTSIQLQESFVNSLDEDQRCDFAETYFSQVGEQLTYYWNILPSRLESYEQERELSTWYLQLKDDYTKLSLKGWMIARDNYAKCGGNTIPVLYFYSVNCSECIAQGEVLDRVREELREEEKEVIVFTIDYNQEEQSLPLIKEYYELESVPAMVIKEKVLQGRLFSQEEILMVFGEER